MDVVVIEGSAGDHDPLRRIIAARPVPCSAAVFVVMHIGPHPSFLPELLTQCGQHIATFPENGEVIEARPDLCGAAGSSHAFRR